MSKADLTGMLIKINLLLTSQNNIAPWRCRPIFCRHNPTTGVTQWEDPAATPDTEPAPTGAPGVDSAPAATSEAAPTDAAPTDAAPADAAPAGP